MSRLSAETLASRWSDAGRRDTASNVSVTTWWRGSPAMEFGSFTARRGCAAQSIASRAAPFAYPANTVTPGSIEVTRQPD